MALDDDGPTVLVPPIPGSRVAAFIGLGLIALLAAAMGVAWMSGTLEERMDASVGFPGASARAVPVVPPVLEGDPVVGRVFVRGVDGASLTGAEIDHLMVEVGAKPLPGVGWRWPQASGDIAIVVEEEGHLEASPVSEQGFAALSDAVEVMNWTLDVEAAESR